MTEQPVSLRDKIIAFIGVIDDCLHETTYSSDRALFTSDMAAAAHWLVLLDRGESCENIVKEIMSPLSDKRFLDYWRNGEWGEREAQALADLRSEIG